MIKQPTFVEIIAGVAALLGAIAALPGNTNTNGSTATPPSITNQNTNNVVIPAPTTPQPPAAGTTPEDVLGMALKNYARSVNPSALIDVTNEGVTVVTDRFIAKVLPEDIRTLRITDQEAFHERLTVTQRIREACEQAVAGNDELSRCVDEKLSPAQNRLLSAVLVISAT